MAKYTDVRLLGSGGFGEVTECIRDFDGLRVAKKRLKADADDDAIKRFVREAKILSKLDHPSVVKVVATHLDSPPYWFAMPLYRSSLDATLPQIVGNAARIESIFGRVLAGISYAHSEGVLHRDIKPQNVLLNDDSDVVVADFGLGRILDSESTRQTITGFGMGSVFYTAPEQYAMAKHADARSDVYSLGRMLFELFAGHIWQGSLDLSEVPQQVSPLIEKATQRDPAMRYANVNDLRLDWERAIAALV